jgi:transcriptional regulator with XRE-family HTH domain
MKRKTKTELPPLCLAVKRVREAYRDSQERFARRIDVALMTVSRFETGRAEPRDPRVLLNLAKVTEEIAADVGPVQDDEMQQLVNNIIEPGEHVEVMTLRGAERLFREAYEDYERIKQTDRELESHGQPAFRRCASGGYYARPAWRSSISPKR